MSASPKSLSASALLSRCRFPEPGTAVDCAVSGGADSLALLVLAVEAGCRVTAHHVDHGLRPGSADEADRVHAAAERFGARFQGHAIRVELGPNVEARARAARYAALPAGVLTGHTADDQAETVLLNLMRGAGIDGLAGMTSDRRPLLGLRRAETEALCAQLELDVFHDPSNDDPRHRRNRVRRELLPLLADIAQRDVVPILARQAHLLRDDIAVLDLDAEDLDPSDAWRVGNSRAALSRRAIRRWLRTAGPGGHEQHPPDAATVERVLAVARGEAVATDVGGGWQVRRHRQIMRLQRPPSSG